MYGGMLVWMKNWEKLEGKDQNLIQFLCLSNIQKYFEISIILNSRD